MRGKTTVHGTDTTRCCLRSQGTSERSGRSHELFVDYVATPGKLPTRNEKIVYARVRKRTITIDPTYVYGRAFVAVDFFCPDPRIYDSVQSTGVMSPITLQGRTYPRTYPLTFTSTTSVTNQVSLYNTGNYITYPTFQFTGICSTPTISNLDTGQTLSFNISLSSTDNLVVNTDLRTVILNGTTNVRNSLAGGSQWFGIKSFLDTATPSLPNGLPTRLVFTTISYSTSQPPVCYITYRNADI